MSQAPETLADFIRRRRREISEAKADLEAELAMLDAETAQLNLAAQAAGIVAVDVVPADAGLTGDPPIRIRVRRRIPSEKTIKDAVIEILRETGRGMEASEILPAVNARLGTEYPRTSLSPQLSRLKDDGLLQRNGTLWSLLHQTPKMNEASAQAEASSNPSPAEDQTGAVLTPGKGD